MWDFNPWTAAAAGSKCLEKRLLPPVCFLKLTTQLRTTSQSEQVCGVSATLNCATVTPRAVELQPVYLRRADNTHSWCDSYAYNTAPRNPSPLLCKHRWSFSHFLWPLHHTATALKTNVPKQALPRWYKAVFPLHGAAPPYSLDSLLLPGRH